MLRKANNVFSVLLNDQSVATTSLPTAGTVVTPANLPAGAIVITDAGMRYLDVATPGANYAALADGAGYFVVQGRGSSKSLMKSPLLTKGKVKFTIAKHKPAVQQVTAIGFNGTTGALPVANNTDFFIKIRKRDNDAANRSQPFSLFAGPVRTANTGATQEELAFALVINGLKNFKDEPANHYLTFEALCAGTQADWVGTATHLSLTNGSKVALFTDGSGVPSTATAPTVGGIVRILGVAYKITASSTTSITLNYAYQGATGLVAGGTTAATQAGIVGTPGDYGVRLTGVAAPFDVNQFRDYYANRFTATFSDSTVPVTHLQGAYNGNGVWQQVAMDEYMSYGYEGENQQLATPSVPRDQFVKIPGIGSNTAATSRYSALNMSWEESISGLVSMDGGKGNVLVYLNLDSSGDLDTGTANNGETFVLSLGLTPGDFDQ
jgi:hypothetical protein